MPETPNQSPTGAEATLVLRKASRSVQGLALLSIEESGLCFSDFAVLEALLHKGPQPVNILGKKVFLTTGSITTAVDRLASRGLVERHESVEDRRVRLVHLTDEGRNLIEPIFARHSRDLENIVSVLTIDERITLVALLKKLGTSAAAGLEHTNGKETE